MDINKILTIKADGKKIDNIKDLLYVEDVTEEELLTLCNKSSGVFKGKLCHYTYKRNDIKDNEEKRAFEIIEEEKEEYSQYRYYVNGKLIKRKDIHGLFEISETTFFTKMLHVKKAKYKGHHIKRVGGDYIYTAKDITTGEEVVGLVNEVANKIGIESNKMSSYSRKPIYFNKTWKISKKMKWSDE